MHQDPSFSLAADGNDELAGPQNSSPGLASTYSPTQTAAEFRLLTRQEPPEPARKQRPVKGRCARHRREGVGRGFSSRWGAKREVEIPSGRAKLLGGTTAERGKGGKKYLAGSGERNIRWPRRGASVLLSCAANIVLQESFLPSAPFPPSPRKGLRNLFRLSFFSLSWLFGWASAEID